MQAPPTTIRLTPKDQSTIDKGAEVRRGSSRAELLRNGGLILANFDKDFYERLYELQERTGLPIHIIVQNIITMWMARQEANEAVFGPSQNIMPEFLYINGRPISHNDLLHSEKQRIMKELEPLKEEMLLEKQAEAPHLMTDEEQAFLERRRRNRELDETIRQEANEARASGLVPDNVRISDTQLSALWGLVASGKLSEECFVDQLKGMVRTNSRFKMGQ